MKLCDNDAYRDEFMALVYGLLMNDETNDRANQIIGAFDSAPEVEAEPAQPNDPLTLSELREMGGFPVWVVPVDGKYFPKWMIVDTEAEVCRNPDRSTAAFDTIGKNWMAYHRRPEEAR